jgi:hypothetical protein
MWACRPAGSRRRARAELRTLDTMAVTYEWCGAFTNAEANELHAEAFETRV